MKHLLLLLLSWLTCFAPLLCQVSAETQTEMLLARQQAAYTHHADFYVANILTGRQFEDYSNTFKQFFMGKYTERGSLVYDGVFFDDIELQYNVYTQNVVALLETVNTERYVVVTPDKVSAFSVYGHDFVNVPGDSVMAGGIYELAYGGEKSSVYIKRTSVEERMVEDGKMRVEYEPVSRYYVSNEFGSFHVTGKKKLIQAYQKSPQLIRIIKTNKLRFSKRQIEQGLVQAISSLEKVELVD